MGGARTFAILLTVAAVCAVAASGCGGGGDSTSASTATTAEAKGPSPTNGEGGGTAGKGQKQGSKGSKGGGSGSNSGGGGSGGEGGSAGVGRAKSFVVPGGDNSIQEYGEEGESGERAEATTVVLALYKALESGKWEVVCGKYLSTSNLEQIETLAEKAPGIKGKGCTEVLGGLNSTSGGKTPDTPAGGVSVVRKEGELAFAIYRGVDGKGYAVPLKREGGILKLTALAATPLEP